MLAKVYHLILLTSITEILSFVRESCVPWDRESIPQQPGEVLMTHMRFQTSERGGEENWFPRREIHSHTFSLLDPCLIHDVA